jgi:hypothetical protein
LKLTFRKSGDLNELLGSLKKKKMSIIQKSDLDWKQFKQKEGLEDELQNALKEKGGFELFLIL